MNLTSINFIAFFVIFFVIYWICSSRIKLQNLVLLAGSYAFYGFASWRFLVLLIVLSLLNYALGLAIEQTKTNMTRRIFLLLGLLIGIGSLAYFKYFNFFIESFNQLFTGMGLHFIMNTLKIIMPLGISYYTFKTLSYLLDVDKGKVKAERNVVVFSNYIVFFPTIMAGPIDLGRNFLPQLQARRHLNYEQTSKGLRQILWGFFKKAVIANNLVLITDPIFEHYQQYASLTLILGALLYAIQLYADFSGYSDMAIGLGRLLGFQVTRNFDFPFFAQNIAEFWRKWHISLTAWLTEYVFTPLSISFRNWGKTGLILAVVINFTLCGLWHDASWNYVLFGFVHGLLFIPLILKGTMNKRNKEVKSTIIPSVSQAIKMSSTFLIVVLTFILFRTKNPGDAIGYLKGIFSLSGGEISPFEQYLIRGNAFVTVFLLITFFILEWTGRTGQYAIEKIGANAPQYLRWAFYALLLFLIGMFSPTSESPFVYLKF